MATPSLNDLILHPRSRQVIDRLIQDLPQSLILAGPSGVGVATCAKAIAQAVDSSVFTITPKKKLENGKKIIEDYETGSIIIDDIRALYQQTRTLADKSQVYIIDFGNRAMTVQAQNAFLKLLEEPRPGLHFILATHQPESLLPTITSRSQRVDLLPVVAAQTATLLDTMKVTDTTKRSRLSFIAGGLPAELIRLCEDEVAYEARAEIAIDAKTFASGNLYDKLVIAHKYKDSRPKALRLLDDVNMQLRAVAKTSPEPRELILQIDRHLKTRDIINANGNIRLQLAADVL